MIQDDVSFTAVKQKEKKEKAARRRPAQGHQAAASDVRVDVLNGGARGRLRAGNAELAAERRGRDQVRERGQRRRDTVSKTTLEYAPDQADQARRLADIMGLSGSALKPGKSVTRLPRACPR